MNTTYLVRLSSDISNPTHWYSAALVTDSEESRNRRKELMALLVANPDLADLPLESHDIEVLKGSTALSEDPDIGGDNESDDDEFALVERIARAFARVEAKGVYALRLGEHNAAALRRLVAMDTHGERLVLHRYDAPVIFCMDDHNREVFSSPAIAALDVRASAVSAG